MNVTTTSITPRNLQMAFPRDRALLKDLFAAARAVNPAISGLTFVTKTHAVMQVRGDSTYYMVEVTPDQARALGYVS